MSLWLVGPFEPFSHRSDKPSYLKFHKWLGCCLLLMVRKLCLVE